MRVYPGMFFGVVQVCLYVGFNLLLWEVEFCLVPLSLPSPYIDRCYVYSTRREGDYINIDKDLEGNCRCLIYCAYMYVCVLWRKISDFFKPKVKMDGSMYLIKTHIGCV